MKPYVGRVRLRVEHVDLIDLENSRRKMTQILLNKSISANQARWAVTQTLDLAADHQLATLRRNQSLDALELAKQKLKLLKNLIDALVEVISKLPPRSTAKLNKILAHKDWQQFDTEMLADIVHAMMRVLPQLSPACVAQEAYLVMSEAPLPASDHNAIKHVIRTAPPAILDLWEAIPAETRVRVEADLRRRSSCKSVTVFLRGLSTMLTASLPTAKRGRRAAINQLFAYRVAKIWHQLQLPVGCAYLERESAHYPSNFQRFCGHALAAVDDDSHVSNRQVRAAQSQYEGRKGIISKTSF